jgi:hypothetical protein
MSAYDWPSSTHSGEGQDDALGRLRFSSSRRIMLDHDGALAAGRRLPEEPIPRRARGGVAPPAPFTPATGTRNLWLPLGPATITDGQATGSPRVAGRVRALAVHELGQRVYAAAANGGIWYSRNGGAEWISIGGFAATNRAGITRPAHRNACGAIAVRFGGTEAGDFVVVGTGERGGFADARPSSKLAGVGVLTATNPVASAGGDPWTRAAKNLQGESVTGIAIKPGGTDIVVATTIGLFTGPTTADSVWDLVPGTPFDSFTEEVTDLLWTEAVGTAPIRLWAWIESTDTKSLWVRSGTDTDFAPVKTIGSTARRGVLAASTPPSRVYVFNDRLGSPALFRIDNSAAALGDAAEVQSVPTTVVDTQGPYDLAISVDPSNADRVALGGEAVDTPGGSFDAAICVGVVSAAAPFRYTGPTFIGVGAHSDVHELVYSNGGNVLWTSCDGGVFRSDHPLSSVGFYPLNDGLNIAQCTFVASHPTCEGRVLLGLQDNGIISRRSNAHWEQPHGGDGGGLAFDPAKPTRYLYQYVKDDWTGSDNTLLEPVTRGGAKTSRGANDDVASFYSSCATIVDTRPGPPPGNQVGQIIIGTNRVWYTEDFGQHWVTLPSATDPIGAASYDANQDRLPEPIIACKWAAPDVAWVLSNGTVIRLARVANSATLTSPGTWIKPPNVILRKAVKNKDDRTQADGPLRKAIAFTDIAANKTSDGTLGSVYLGTTGKPNDDSVDTLWWFDGVKTWHATGLRKDPNGVPAPVTAVMCDPAHTDLVYVGTTIGVWRGTQTQPAPDPKWTWEPLLNGLPEAAIEDLSLFDNGGVRLLRAAIAARGLWEMEIDTDVIDLTYLRVHDDDLRRRKPTASLVGRGGSTRSWHGSPDIRARVASTAAPLLGAAATWSKASPPSREILRRFQSALRADRTDPRVRPTGKWSKYFDDVLRDLGAPIVAGKVVLNAGFWNPIVTANGTAEPWGTAIPTEADLIEYTSLLGEGLATEASGSMPAKKLKVEVVVQHRGPTDVSGSDIKVTLLQWIDPKKKGRARFDDVASWFPGNIPWADAVVEVLNSPSGKTAKPMSAGWQFVLGNANNNAIKRLDLAGQTVGNLTPGIATFDINLEGAAKDLLVLLVAVVKVGPNITIANVALQDLVLSNPGVACRSLNINPT